MGREGMGMVRMPLNLPPHHKFLSKIGGNGSHFPFKPFNVTSIVSLKAPIPVQCIYQLHS
jgi:hypothetical protein